MKSSKFEDTIEGLIRIVKKLRSPDGCEWDKKQTSESLVPYFLEEVHEVIDAGHLVVEDAYERIIPWMRAFLQKNNIN